MMTGRLHCLLRGHAWGAVVVPESSAVHVGCANCPAGPDQPVPLTAGGQPVKPARPGAELLRSYWRREPWAGPEAVDMFGVISTAVTVMDAFKEAGGDVNQLIDALILARLDPDNDEPQ